MAAAVIGALRVTLGADTVAFEQGLNRAQKELARTGKQMTALGGQMQRAGAAMTVGITAPFIALGFASVKAAKESREAIGQVNAALASMGTQAGKTAGDLEKSAKQLMKISTFDDDEILRKVTANLLTFGQVAGEQFDRAQLAAVNLATRLGGDLQAATMLVGKALNDPVKGIAALKRAGVQLTDQQKKSVEGFVAVGNAAGAQRIILAELEKQFGGSAKAMRDASPDAALINAWDDFQEIVGEVALNVLPKILGPATDVLEAFNGMSSGAQMAVIGVAAIAAAAGPVVAVLGTVVSIAGAAGGALAAMGSSSLVASAGLGTLYAAAGPVVLILGGLAAAIGVYTVAVGNAKTASADTKEITDKLGAATRDYGQAVAIAAGKVGDERAALLDGLKAKRADLELTIQQTRANLAHARSRLQAASAEQSRIAATRETIGRTGGAGEAVAGLGFLEGLRDSQRRQAAANADALSAALEQNTKDLAAFEAILNKPIKVGGVGDAIGAGGKKSKAAKGLSDVEQAAKKAAEELKAALEAMQSPADRAAAQMAANLAIIEKGFKAGTVAAEDFAAAVLFASLSQMKLSTDAPRTPGDLTQSTDALAALDSTMESIGAEVKSLEDVFDRTKASVGAMAGAFESHDWAGLSKSLKTTIEAVKVAFGSNGTTAGKIGAIAGIADAAGQVIGGRAGGALSGAASGAMAGLQFGPYGAAAGAVIGGVASLLSSGKAQKAAKAAEAAKKAEEALTAARNAAAAAAQKVLAIAAERRELEITLMEAAGDKVGALAARRADELAALDESNRALKTQVNAWDDYNAALAEAESAIGDAQARVDSARSDLVEAYDREAAALEAVINGVDEARAKLSEAYEREAEGLRATIGAVEQARSDLTAAYDREAEALRSVIAGVDDERAALAEAYERESSAIKETRDRFADFADTLKEFRQDLVVSSLTGGRATAAAAARFAATTAAARGGDAGAMGAFTGVAGDFLTSAKASAGSALDLARDQAKVRAATLELEAMAGEQVTIAEQQLAALSASVAGLLDLNASVLSVEDAIAALQTALAASAEAERQLAALDASVAGLRQVDASVLSVRDAIGALQSAEAAAAIASEQLAALDASVEGLLDINAAVLGVKDAILGVYAAEAARASAQQQLAALNASVANLGVLNSSVLTVAQAVANLAEAQGAFYAAQATRDAIAAGAPSASAPIATAPDWSQGGALWNAWAQSGVTNGAPRGNVLADWSRSEMLFLQEYQNAAAVGSLSSLDAYWGLSPGTAASYAAKYNLPAFASGGTGTVGGTGGLDSQFVGMRLTPGELVNVSQGDPLNDNVEQSRIMNRKLDVIAAGIVAVARNTRASAKTQKQWDGDGLPAERVI